jgi:hypothetical protein
MKNQISRLLIVGGFAVAFVAGSASHLIPGANSVTAVAAQEKHEALRDVRGARDMMQQARGLLAGAPGSFGGHREKAMKHLDLALGEANQALEVREHENH